jgi:hypothetical protein
MAIDHFRRISSPSISARRTTGISQRARRHHSGLSGFTADEMTITCGVAEILGVGGRSRPECPARRSACVLAPSARRALHLVAEIVQHLGDAAHADAADADEVDDADVERNGPHAATPA